MHKEHTSKTASDAMPSFTRRALMVAAIVAPAAPASAGENTLPWLLDAFREIRQAMDSIEFEISENDRDDELAGQLLKFENQILDHRCTTYKECADKAAWFDEAFSGLDVPQYFHRLLQSMQPAGVAGEA